MKITMMTTKEMVIIMAMKVVLSLIIMSKLMLTV